MAKQRSARPGSARAARAEQKRQLKRRKRNRVGMICISLVVLCMLFTMASQIFKLYQTSLGYKEREEELMTELEGELERKEEIAAYEKYVTTPEYIEEIAKTKLGLVYENEIIFREEDEGHNP